MRGRAETAETASETGTLSREEGKHAYTSMLTD